MEGPWQLYNMETDRTELVNLSDQEPDLVQRLAGQWEEWAKRTGAKVPSTS